MKMLPTLVLCLGAWLSIAGCGRDSKPQGKPVAVASVFCYYDALRAIGGEDIEVAILLPPGRSPHEYSATVSDRQMVGRAKLLVSNGLGLDEWAHRLGGGNRNLVQLELGEKMAAIETRKEPAATAKKEEAHAGHEHAADPHAGHGHGPQNPHVWLDPQNQIKAAEAIRDALMTIDPAHRGGFASRAGIYIEELRKLDDEFREATAKFKHREFVGFHSAYDYLARRYGLIQVAALQEAGPEGLNPAQVQKVIQIIRDRKVPVLFMETAFDTRQVQPVVAATGIKLGTLQPLETYDKLEDTYVSLMRQNLAELKKAME